VDVINNALFIDLPHAVVLVEEFDSEMQEDDSMITPGQVTGGASLSSVSIYFKYYFILCILS
jgi:hypothetical protein